MPTPTLCYPSRAATPPGASIRRPHACGAAAFARRNDVHGTSPDGHLHLINAIGRHRSKSPGTAADTAKFVAFPFGTRRVDQRAASRPQRSIQGRLSMKRRRRSPGCRGRVSVDRCAGSRSAKQLRLAHAWHNRVISADLALGATGSLVHRLHDVSSICRSLSASIVRSAILRHLTTPTTSPRPPGPVNTRTATPHRNCEPCSSTGRFHPATGHTPAGPARSVDVIR